MISAAGAEVVLNDVSPHLSIAASSRARGEFYCSFEPSEPVTHDYAFGATVLRFGTQWRDELFDAVVEGQNSALFGLPDDAVAYMEATVRL